MIVRIMGEGQRALDAGDAAAFRSALTSLLDSVRETGRCLPLDSLAPSDLLLPPADASLDEVRAMLGDEGLIPG